MLRKDMSTHSHIFTPANNSLQARIEALKDVLKASRNIKLSLELSGNNDWGNRLGSPEELHQAKDITQRSLDMAIKELSLSDLQQAKQQGLISGDDFNNCKILKAKSDLHTKRQSENEHSKSKQK